MMGDCDSRTVNRRTMATVAIGALVSPLAAGAAPGQVARGQGALTDALRQSKDMADRAAEAPIILDKLNVRGENIGGNAEALRAAIGADRAENIRITPLGAGAQTHSIEDYLNTLPVNVLGFIPTDEHAAIRSGTSAYDSTSAFQAALDFLNQSGVTGSLFVPRGVYNVTSLMIDLSSPVPLKIFGEGPRSSSLKKLGVGPGPVLRVNGTGVLDSYILLEDFSVIGASKVCTGLEFESLARFRCMRIDVQHCATGFNLVGALTAEFVKCTANDNVTGLKARKNVPVRPATAIFPNLLVFDRFEARSNMLAGVDLGDGEGHQFFGCDLTANGTRGDSSTGSVVLRNSIGDETGIGTVGFSGCHFEVNEGAALLIEGNSKLHLVINETSFYQSENGRAVVMNGKIGSANLLAVKAAAAGDVIQINAAYSCVTGGQIFTLADTSTYRRHHLLTGGEARGNWMNNCRLTGGTAGNDLLVWTTDKILGAGSSNDHMFYKYGAGATTFSGAGGEMLSLKNGGVGFYGVTPAHRATISGALSSVSDPSASAILTSIVAALSGCGLALNSTT